MSNYLWVSELYTPLSQALNELQERRSNPHLIKKVSEYFAGQASFPELGDEPRAVIAPPIFSPNLESISFVDIAEYLPLKPLVCEFADDKFVHLNVQKKCLGHMTFMQSTSLEKKHSMTESIRVIDFDKWQGKSMSDAETNWGENFVNFHHRLAQSFFGEKNQKIEVVNFSDWYRHSKEFNPAYPYMRFLGLFLTNGILFANFTTGKWEKEFTDTIVIPAYRKIKEELGIAPLIVPLEPMETDDLSFWCYYPERVKDLLHEHGI